MLNKLSVPVKYVSVEYVSEIFLRANCALVHETMLTLKSIDFKTMKSSMPLIFLNEAGCQELLVI